MEALRRIWLFFKKDPLGWLRIAVISMAVVAVFATAAWLWLVVEPRRDQIIRAARAASDLESLAQLQDRYRRAHGVYAGDLEALLSAAPDPRALRGYIAQHLDIETLLVKGTSATYILEANALDRDRTLIHIEGRPAQKL